MERERKRKIEKKAILTIYLTKYLSLRLFFYLAD